MDFSLIIMDQNWFINVTNGPYYCKMLIIEETGCRKYMGNPL